MDDDMNEVTNEQPQPRKKKPIWLMILFPLLITALPLWFIFIGPQIRHDRLVEKGVHAPGRLIDLDETGTYVNDSPELELVIEFTRKDGTLDTGTCDFVPSRRTIHMYQVGAVVTASYDPEDPEEITLVDIAPPASQMLQMQAPSGASVDSLRRAVDSMAAELKRLKGE
jgi:hypothetical protein